MLRNLQNKKTYTHTEKEIWIKIPWIGLIITNKRFFSISVLLFLPFSLSPSRFGFRKFFLSISLVSFLFRFLCLLRCFFFSVVLVFWKGCNEKTGYFFLCRRLLFETLTFEKNKNNLFGDISLTFRFFHLKTWFLKLPNEKKKSQKIEKVWNYAVIQWKWSHP